MNEEQKTRETTPGKTYSVHTMKGCTIIEPDGWQKTIDAPDGYFTAHAGEVTIDGDDAADVRELFKLAPYQKLRLLGVVGGNGGLPAGYKRVEYLESSGTQYVLTDVYNWGKSVMTCSFSIEKPIDTSDHRTLVGSVFASDANGNIITAGYYRATPIVHLHRTNYGHGLIGQDNTFFAFYPEISQNYKAEISSENCKINGVIYGDFGEIVTTTSRMSLFASVDLSLGMVRAYTNGARIYSYAITGEKQCHMIPALDPTGAPCMYDLVSRKPFYNQGSGDFLYPTEATTYSLRRVLPDWGQLTEYGLRRLYHAPADYTGELYDYAVENGYKPIIEPEKPAEGYWSPRWTETADEIVLEWAETEPPMDEPLINN